MRIYINPYEAIRETERDLWEHGIAVHPQTMQDKDIHDNPDFDTKELRGYGFKLSNWQWKADEESNAVDYVFKEGGANNVRRYIQAEHEDRLAPIHLNPGNSFKERFELWKEYLHKGKFAYTYNERMQPQIRRTLSELRERPETRQAIVQIHSRIASSNGHVYLSEDLMNMGGKARIPCSMYYQIMVREKKVDLIYTMRSCDFLNHFVIDFMLACRLQMFFADNLGLPVGMFTYFTGSLHAYRKDLKDKGIF